MQGVDKYVDKYIFMWINCGLLLTPDTIFIYG
jgi:hypothetical protein